MSQQEMFLRLRGVKPLTDITVRHLRERCVDGEEIILNSPKASRYFKYGDRYIIITSECTVGVVGIDNIPYFLCDGETYRLMDIECQR